METEFLVPNSLIKLQNSLMKYQNLQDIKGWMRALHSNTPLTHPLVNSKKKRGRHMNDEQNEHCTASSWPLNYKSILALMEPN